MAKPACSRSKGILRADIAAPSILTVPRHIAIFLPPFQATLPYKHINLRSHMTAIYLYHSIDTTLRNVRPDLTIIESFHPTTSAIGMVWTAHSCNVRGSTAEGGGGNTSTLSGAVKAEEVLARKERLKAAYRRCRIHRYQTYVCTLLSTWCLPRRCWARRALEVLAL